MKLILKFWDNERKIMLESPQSVLTAFRNYINIAGFTHFSDCDNQPNSKNTNHYFSLEKDSKGVELFTTDVVKIRLDVITQNPVQSCVYGIIDYDEKECCFCARVLQGEEFELLPLFGIMDAIEKIGNEYDLPHPLSLL